MVTKEGLSIDYQAFSGDTWEGDTLIPMLKDIRSKYDLDKIIFVADSGLFCQKNLEALEVNNFQYIVGARLKNLTKNLTSQILDLDSYESICADDKNLKDKLKIKKFIYLSRIS